MPALKVPRHISAAATLCSAEHTKTATPSMHGFAPRAHMIWDFSPPDVHHSIIIWQIEYSCTISDAANDTANFRGGWCGASGKRSTPGAWRMRYVHPLCPPCCRVCVRRLIAATNLRLLGLHFHLLLHRPIDYNNQGDVGEPAPRIRKGVALRGLATIRFPQRNSHCI